MKLYICVCEAKTILTVSFQISLKVARDEHQKQEQLHLDEKQELLDRLHEKDVQYQVTPADAGHGGHERGRMVTGFQVRIPIPVLGLKRRSKGLFRSNLLTFFDYIKKCVLLQVAPTAFGSWLAPSSPG